MKTMLPRRTAAFLVGLALLAGGATASAADRDQHPDRVIAVHHVDYTFHYYGHGYYYHPRFGYWHPDYGFWNERSHCWDRNDRYDRDDNPPGPRGGPGTNWENPPGAEGGPGSSPDRYQHCDDDRNPPGRAGGPGTNWENPPGPAGGPGASRERFVVIHGTHFVFTEAGNGFYFNARYGYWHPDYGFWDERSHCWHRDDFYDRDNNPPGPRGGHGTNWENPPGMKGGPGASPDRNRHCDDPRSRPSTSSSGHPARYLHIGKVKVKFSYYGNGYYFNSRYGYWHEKRGFWNEKSSCWMDRDNNPPGPRGGPGTNWENPPGEKGGPGSSPDKFGKCR